MAHVVCKPKCAGDWVRLKAKKEKAETKRRKEAVLTRAEWLGRAQAAFNKWIKLRDKDEPCISCGVTVSPQWDCGHYLSRGSNPALRFDEDNCHKQCVKCNNYLSGNAIHYRIGLVKKIGLERVERLEGPHAPKKYTVEQIREIRQKYFLLAKELG